MKRRLPFVSLKLCDVLYLFRAGESLSGLTQFCGKVKPNDC